MVVMMILRGLQKLNKCNRAITEVHEEEVVKTVMGFIQSYH